MASSSFECLSLELKGCWAESEVTDYITVTHQTPTDAGSVPYIALSPSDEK